MRQRRRWLAAIALLAAGLTAGCGGSSGDGDGASASGDRAVRFAACMREHGVSDFPDPVDGRIVLRAGRDPAAMQAAQQACRKLAPGGGSVTRQMQEQLLAFTQCMRDHGVPDFPDPEGPGRLLIPRTIDVESPQFEQARQACQDKLRGSGWGEGGGVGG